MQIEIKDFTPADREGYLRMSQTFYRSTAVDHTIPAANFATTFDLCVTGSPYVRGLMIRVEGIPAGYALFSLTHSNEAGGLCVLLEEIYILPDFQGKGLGSAMFDFIGREYVDSGKAKRLRLEVTPVNQGAIRLYQRQGFQNLDYVQMVKDL